MAGDEKTVCSVQCGTFKFNLLSNVGRSQDGDAPPAASCFSAQSFSGCKKSRKSCCTRGTTSITYLMLLTFSVLALAAVPITVHYRGVGGGRPCPRDYDYYYEDDGTRFTASQWCDYVDVADEYQWHDVAALCCNGAVVMFSTLALVGVVARCKVALYVLCALILVGGITQVVTGGVLAGTVEAHGFSWLPVRIARHVEEQLRGMVIARFGYDSEARSMWEGVQSRHCCCGVLSYKEFNDYGLEVPPLCSCVNTTTNNYDWQRSSQQWKCPHIDRWGNTQRCQPIDLDDRHITPHNCFPFLIETVQYKYKDILIANYILMFSVGGAQILLAIVSMLTLCCFQKEPSKVVYATSDSWMANQNKPEEDQPMYTTRQPRAQLTEGGRTQVEDDMPIDISDERPIVA